MFARFDSRQAPIFFVIVVWVNAYVCRELFLVDTRAQMNSMHGFWTALAKWAGMAWWTPGWWPYWDGGMPFEYTYAPLVPALMAAVAHLGGISELRAFHILTGLVYCLGPASLYLSMWRLTGSAVWSFAAAIAYSLLSPALLLAPGDGFPLASLVRAERLYVMSVWDETPHMLALALWPIAVLSLFRIVETRRVTWLAFGVLAMAAMVYASAFGATLLAISALCLLAALGWDRSRAAWLVTTGVLTYLAACIALPPSLVQLIRDAAEFTGQGWSARSWTALAIVAVVLAALLPAIRSKISDSRLRFFVLFALTCLLIVWLHEWGGRQIVPQPGRYKLELSIGLTLATVFGIRLFWGRLGRFLQLALIGLFVALAAEQVVAHRKWAKVSLRGQDIGQTIEYRAANWMDTHLPLANRVMVPGSIAQWMNAFSQRSQFAGSSWATAPSNMQQRALQAIYQEVGGTEGSLTWLQAFGVQAVMVTGKQSSEVWKPFADTTKFDGQLEPLWKEKDATLYAVPARTRSLAHAVPETARSTGNWDGVQRYVAALNSEHLPGLMFAFNGRDRAIVRGEVRSGEAVSIQVNYHPGWQAFVDNRRIPMQSDGIGLMWIRPACNGPCNIELRYTGGLELVLCRWLSGLTLLAVFGALLWSCGMRFRQRRKMVDVVSSVHGAGASSAK